MNKTLLKSLREYKKESLLAPLFIVLEVLMEVLIPIQMARIIDKGITNQDMTYVFKTGFILVIIAMLALLFGVLSGRYASIASAGYSKNIRKDLFYKIQDFSFKNIDKFSTSSLVTRLTSDITNLQMAFMFNIRLLARTVCMMILPLFMILSINKKIALVFLIVVPILAIALGLIIKIAYPLYIQSFKEYDILNKKVQENVNAARVVKAYVRQDFETNKFKDTSSKVYNLYAKAGKVVSFDYLAMQFTIYTVILAILLLGGKNIVYGKMASGELTTLIIYAIQILMALMMMSFVFVMNLIAQASIERITEVLNETSDIQNPENPIKDIKNGDISFKDVSFSYSGIDGNLSLKNINIDIKSGQTIGIIGETGSSKSTLVQLIPRLYDATYGSVEVGGIDVKKYDLETLRDEVSMVLQKNTLFTGTIEENIKWGNPNASLNEVIRVSRLACADNFIQEFPDKYNTQIVQGGNNVSGGQKQRICIARALLKKPKILILDDSTSAVDTKTDYLIRKAFKEEIPDTTKIIIAQRISSIEDADLIIVLDDGQINGIGTSKELLENNKIFQDIYNSQVKGGE
ncbi:ABC transporter ATP-binding protein [Pseudostreptobacillus hongkongensis]|uniref:ABC transporter ATP-binding protein n=1 Tax=Pseudostreptobacillus hongkongensis TaxID=1162717 RepID=UPI0028D17150|nr:ABC transporter ATP-binding protein [Pseudostreptobacillus hongkongensis]